MCSCISVVPSCETSIGPPIVWTSGICPSLVIAARGRLVDQTTRNAVGSPPMGRPALLDEAIAAHGGGAYDSAQALEVDVSCSGWAFVLKRQRGAFRDFTGTVSTSEPRVVLDRY